MSHRARYPGKRSLRRHPGHSSRPVSLDAPLFFLLVSLPFLMQLIARQARGRMSEFPPRASYARDAFRVALQFGRSLPRGWSLKPPGLLGYLFDGRNVGENGVQVNIHWLLYNLRQMHDRVPPRSQRSKIGEIKAV